MSTFNKLIWAVVIALIIYIFASAYNFVSAFALSYNFDVRSDACRTFHLFAHEAEQTGETDAHYCGVKAGYNDNQVITVTAKPDNDAPTSTPIPDVPEIPPVIPSPAIPDNPTCGDCIEKNHPSSNYVYREDNKEHPSTNDCPPGTMPVNYEDEISPNK